MVILGIDPGIRHTGYVLLKDNRLIARGTLIPPGKGRVTLAQVIPFLLAELGVLIGKADVAAVEEVVWQGHRRRTMFPLAHIAGALVAALVARGVPTYLLTPAMKSRKPISKGIARRLKSDHERDAYNLAIIARNAESAIGTSCNAKPVAVARRRLSVGGSVHGRRG